jgi:hypothetical protein
MLQLDPREAIAVAFPVCAMLLVAIALILHKLKYSKAKHAKPGRRMRVIASHAVLGLTFLPLSIIYRPSLLEVSKAQIRQQEDVDEDESADPESPLKHLFGQLRRIRRGEKLGTLSLRRK